VPDFICSNCGEVLEEAYYLPSPNRTPCPKCGDLRRNFYVRLEEKVIVRDGIGIRARRSNQRKPFYESYGGPAMSHARGKHVHKARTMDRENDEYREYIQDYETGEVIHHCEEPLSAHKGHGDAKKKKE
jgi:hypothetical protein